MTTTRTADVVAKGDFRDLFDAFKRTGRVVHDLEEDFDKLGDASVAVDQLGEAVGNLGREAAGASALPRAVEAANRAAREATVETRKQAAAARSVAQAHASGREEIMGTLSQQREATQTLGRGQAEVEQLVAREISQREALLSLEDEIGAQRRTGQKEATAGARRLQDVMSDALRDEAQKRAKLARLQQETQQAAVEALQHQHRLAKAKGGDQEKIERLIQREAALRREMALAEGNATKARRVARAEEVRLARGAAKAKKLEVQAQRDALDALRHQSQLAKAKGTDQARVEQLVQKEAALRREMALSEGNAIKARRVARAEALRLARRAAQVEKAAAKEEERSATERATTDSRHWNEKLEALQHQRRMAEALEDSQEKIDDLVAQEFAIRRQMAVLEGDIAASRTIAREQELRGALKLRELGKRRAAAGAAAADRQIQVEAEHAASQHRALEAQENALRRQLEVRELTGMGALRVESQILGLQLRQAKVGVAATADERHRKQQRTLDLQARQVLMAKKIKAANKSILPPGQFDKMQAGWQGVTSKAMAAAGALAMVGAAVAGIDRLMEASVKLDAIYKNLPFGIDAARTATKGLVSETELAQAAIEAQRLGVVDSEEGFAELAQAAMKLGLSVGRGAADSVRDLTAALGKGETELLDNLGIKLRVSEAEKAYAARLGVSKSMLTDAQKAEAFRTMGLLKTLEAAEQVNIEVNGGAAKWAEWKAQAAELGRDVLPRVINVLEVLIDVLEFYGEMWGTVLGTVDDAIDQMFLWADAASLGEDATRSMVRGVSALNTELLGGMYAVDQLAKTYEQLDQKREAEATAKASETAREKELATRDSLLAQDKQLLWEMEKQRKVMEAQGGSQGRLNELVELQVLLEADVLETQGKELDAEKLLLEHEVRKIKDRKKRAEEWAQAYDQRLSREREGSLAELAARRSIVEAEGELRTRSADRYRVELDTVRAARQELDIREAIADRMRGGTADQRHEREQERLEITTERRLLDVEAMAIERDRAEELAEWQLASIDREIERRESLGEVVDDLRERRRQGNAEMALHFGTENELAAALHEADLERRSEKQAELELEHEALLERQDREIERLEAQGQAVEQHKILRLDLEARLAAAEGNQEAARTARHKAEIARLREQAAVRKKVHGAVDSLMTQTGAVAEFAAEQAIRSDERREAVFKKVQGSMAIARAAVELVEGVAAAARYDFVSAAQHFIASGLGFAKGAVLLAGGLPGRGGGGGGGAANGGSYAAPGASAGQGAAPGSGPDEDRSVPLSGTGVTGDDLGEAKKSAVGSSSGSNSASTTVNVYGPVIGQSSDKLLSEIHTARSA